MPCASIAQRAPVRFVLASTLAWLALLLGAAAVAAAPTAEQVREIARVSTAVQKAGNLYTQGKHAEAGEAIKEAQTGYDQLLATGDRDVLRALEPIYTRLVRAHALLELEGIALPALKRPILAAPAPAPTPGAPAGAGAVSFVNQVAPLLAGKCGRCHVSEGRGGFRIGSFTQLMQGSTAGVVIFRGDADGSRIVEVIESGDMPRGGGRVTPAELALLKKWIAEGARFDGADEAAPLNQLAAASAPAPMPEMAAPAGPGTVSFARDVASLLTQCADCHGANQPRAGLRINTFAGLLRGGDSGAAITAGRGADSLLVKKLRGTADGQRMPLNRTPLTDAQIAKIETWINEGARFDAPSQDAPLTQVAALARASGATHEQLSADRAELAEKNWLLGMPGVNKQSAETKNFLLLGNIGENTLADIGRQAEEIAPKVATLLKAPADQPLVKGRLTLYVFDTRYDYSEFGQMVERRQLPPSWRGHWNFTVVDAYGAMVPSRLDEYSTEGLLAQQIAGAYMASLGRGTPRWFAEGVARQAAERIAADDPRVKSWSGELGRVLGSMSAPDDFLTGKLPPEDAEIAAHHFAGFLMSNSRAYTALLTALRGGAEFNQAFSSAYGGNPNQQAAAWAPRAARDASRNRPR